MGAHKVPRAYRHIDAISLIKPTISMGTLQLYFKTFKKSIGFSKKFGGKMSLLILKVNSIVEVKKIYFGN